MVIKVHTSRDEKGEEVGCHQMSVSTFEVERRERKRRERKREGYKKQGPSCCQEGTHV